MQNTTPDFIPPPINERTPMSLEERMNSLTKAVEALTSITLELKDAYVEMAKVINGEANTPEEKDVFDKAIEAKAEAPKAEEPKAEEPKAEEPKAEAPKAEAPKAEEKPLTLDDIKPLIIKVVEAKGKEAAIALVKATGAEGLTKVPADKLPELKAAAEALLGGE